MAEAKGAATTDVSAHKSEHWDAKCSSHRWWHVTDTMSVLHGTFTPMN
jgi:hypothetical protein